MPVLQVAPALPGDHVGLPMGPGAPCVIPHVDPLEEKLIPTEEFNG